MTQSLVCETANDHDKVWAEVRYGFECVLDAAALIAMLQNQDKHGTMLEKWLRSPLVKVYIAQNVLNTLKGQRTDAAQRTLLGLDRITNHFSNVKFEQSFECYETLEELLRAPSPAVYWHDFVANRSADNDEIAALSASLGNAMKISSKKDEANGATSLPHEQLGDSAPIAEQPSAKMLAPIGTGRPGRSKSVQNTANEAMSPNVDKASAHPVLRHMWFKMNQQHESDTRSIWLLVSSNPLLEHGAKELGVPCMSHESLDKVLCAEFPEVNERSSVNSQAPNTNGGFSSPMSMQSQYSQHHHSAIGDTATHNGHTVSPRNGWHVDQRGRHSANQLQEDLRFTSAENGIPTAPRSMRTNGPVEVDRHKTQNEIIMVDPNSFNRSQMTENGSRSARRGRADFTPGHRHRKSDHEPPPNAPTGPRSMSGSSGRSRPNVKALSPSPSPVLKSSMIIDQQIAVTSVATSPRLSSSHFHKVQQASFQAIQRPASRGTIASTQPGSPRLEHGSPQPTTNHRGQRPPRHVPYLPPKAREQLVQQQEGKLETPTTTSPAANIDLSRPIDPDSFGRGQIAQGLTKSQPVSQHHNTGHKRGNATRGGSMRGREGRGGRGSMRGRGNVNGNRKLFDPS